jgi:FtsP/CotA-like multicopper oxidase with cupredoxin domain
MPRSLARRDLIKSGAVAGGALLLGSLPSRAAVAHAVAAAEMGRSNAAPEERARVVTVPDGALDRGRLVDGVRVFHLVAEPVEHELAPGLHAMCWGYNGRVHGPVLDAREGERVRIYLTNRLPEPTTLHCHGMLLPNGMDGVGGLNQSPILPGETFKYEFTLQQHGTFMYHPHHDEMTQIALGMVGMFIVHPRVNETAVPADRDFAIVLHEWRIDVGTSRPNPGAMSDFNVLTMNGRAFPGTTPLGVQSGERVRIRLGNLGPMDHHAIHLHGHVFHVVATDGGDVPESAQWPETTVLVPVGSTRTIEFVAAPGDWALHCHMTHHAMNQMGHGANLIGIDPGDLDQRARQVLPDYMTMGQRGMADMAATHMPAPDNSIAMRGGPGPFGPITMGGMFTIVKVRDPLASDSPWYPHPPGTVAARASDAELRADGIIDS